MELDVVILSLVIATGVTALVANRDGVVDGLRRFVTTPTHPANLAVFRVVIAATVLVRVWQTDPGGAARRLADVPDALQIAPGLLGDLVPTLPISDGLITLTAGGLVGGTLLVLVGLWSRTAATVAALSAVYLFGVPNWFGKVNHDHLHLIWFLALLAAAPASDALSVASWLRRRRGDGPPAPSVAHALPLRATWLLLGLVYLSAGLGKVIKVGFDWPLDHNMRNFLWLHWVWHDPPLRVDEWGPIVVAAGFATLAFELGFLPAIFSRRLRPFAAIAGFSFHAGVWWLMGIAHFWTLMAAYVAFVPWNTVLRRRRPGREPDALPAVARSISRSQAAVTGAVVALVAVTAISLREQAWPVSAYPSFGYRQPTTDSRLEMVAVVDGEERPVEGLAGSFPIGAARFRFLTLRTLALPDGAERDVKLAALWAVARDTGRLPAETDAIRIYRETFSIDPDDDGKVIDRALEATLDAST